MNNILPGFKETAEFMRFMYFPLSKKQKKQLLFMVQSRVDMYIPKMEEIVNMDLGSVKVESMPQFFENHYHKSLFDLTMEKGPAYAQTLDYKITSYSFSIATSAMKSLHHPLCFVRGVIMKYNENNIYIPFNLYNRLNFNSLINKKNVMDDMIVHELSHHLWNQINSADDSNNFFLERSWSEGFAEYCMNDYFNKKGFYEGVTPRLGYVRHHNKIKNFLDKNGEDLLLEIPKRWKEFDKMVK